MWRDCARCDRSRQKPSRDEAVGAEVKRHIEVLNPTQDVGIRSISCEERGPVPSMGTNAAAFLCSIHPNNGEATKPQLWAYLPQDEENHVELLDETAERELAARGEVAGLNDGHSEADNRSAEQDIHHAEEEVNGSADTTAKRERGAAPPPTTVSTTTKIDGKAKRAYTGATPYDLRHSFASLMFHEQRNPLEIADMLGHSPQVLFSTYAHVIHELRGEAPISAEDQIRAARSSIHGEDA